MFIKEETIDIKNVLRITDILVKERKFGLAYCFLKLNQMLSQKSEACLALGIYLIEYQKMIPFSHQVFWEKNVSQHLARRYLKKALKDNDRIWILIGFTYLIERKYEKGLRCFKLASVSGVQNVFGIWCLLVTEYMLKDWENVLELYEENIKIIRDDPQIAFWAAIVAGFAARRKENDIGIIRKYAREADVMMKDTKNQCDVCVINLLELTYISGDMKEFNKLGLEKKDVICYVESPCKKEIGKNVIQDDVCDEILESFRPPIRLIEWQENLKTLILV